MTSTPQTPGDPDSPDEVEDQDAEPTMNAPADERPDGQEPSEDGGSTEDVI